jgi:hypothetical protein
MIIPTVPERYSADVATAVWAGSMAAWRLMKRADWAMPVPRPLVILSRILIQDIMGGLTQE